MERIAAFTLVDVTPSGVTGEDNMHLSAYHQMQNLHMLLQVIGMRAQPLDYRVEILDGEDMANHRFGGCHAGIHRVWRLEFSTEHRSAWDDGEDEFGELRRDIANVSIVNDLDNTADFPKDCFDALEDPNIYFARLEDPPENVEPEEESGHDGEPSR